jgi:hypothetical protein
LWECVLKNPALVKAGLLVLVAVLYDRRAKYEEDVLSYDRAYVKYLRQMEYRFIPGAY